MVFVASSVSASTSFSAFRRLLRGAACEALPFGSTLPAPLFDAAPLEAADLRPAAGWTRLIFLTGSNSPKLGWQRLTNVPIIPVVRALSQAVFPLQAVGCDDLAHPSNKDSPAPPDLAEIGGDG